MNKNDFFMRLRIAVKIRRCNRLVTKNKRQLNKLIKKHNILSDYENNLLNGENYLL